MATAGYNATFKVGGVSTTLTDEATTEVSTDVYQITNAAKRVLDPDVAVVVEDEGGNPLTDYTVDYFTGTITFLTSPLAASVTVSGAYIPLATAAEARASSISCSMADLDTSIHGEAFTKFLPGKATAEITLETIAAVSQVLDGGSLSWESIFNGRSLAVFEASFAGRMFRAWVRLPSLTTDMAQDGVVTGNVTARSTSRTATDGTEVAYSFFDAD